MTAAPPQPSSLHPSEEELSAWLRLLLTPGVGRASARCLLAACGSAQAIWQGPHSLWPPGLTSAQAKALSEAPPRFEEQLDATRLWLASPPQDLAHALIPLGHAQYPESLLQTEDPPLLLFVQASAARLHGNAPWFPYPQALAMVGSRNPTAQGRANAALMAQALVEAGLCIVSGLAQGVDASAHEGALRAARQRTHSASPAAATIAVVGTGLDQVYPLQHQALALQVARHGLMVSEYPLGTPPLARHFPQRNRIISGLAQGTLVVEATLQSGSLITARLAAEQGREVFAIPGSIHAPQSRGCHKLLREGAKLVETAQDVLEELQGLAIRRPPGPAKAKAPPQPPPATAPASENPVLQALGHDPLLLDSLMERTGLGAARLQARLLDLELEGLVARLPGGLYQRLERG
ncbi:DNA-processing protein DprA [Comamonas composti]|uniref:DNA-processing protein DprA n=1 Tax=Comamonas composti TaxID=408558 RepID=UPI0004287E1C|nr:DNA-processing protein DprA [Comamonas composti]